MYCWLWHFNSIVQLLCVMLFYLLYYLAILPTTLINACLSKTSSGFKIGNWFRACSFAKNKAGFYKAFNSIFGKIWRNASEKVLFALIKSKCLPVLFYGTEACPITSADKHSLEFTMNKVLYKIFGAMSKDSYSEICKYFGIDKVEESIDHRQEKKFKRYSGYSNSLCHSISARLWYVKLVILYYCLFTLCVFLLNLRYFLCYHVMVNKVV